MTYECFVSRCEKWPFFGPFLGPVKGKANYSENVDERSIGPGVCKLFRVDFEHAVIASNRHFRFGKKYKLLKVGARSLPVMYFSKTYFLLQEQRIFSFFFFVSEFSSTDSNDLW